MRYAPYPSEARAVPNMGDGELMEYFLMRAFETEEVWALRNTDGWLLQRRAEQLCLPVWPYRQFADETVVQWRTESQPTAQSLEFFINDTLLWLIDDDIGVDIMPRQDGCGCLMSPHRLLSIIEGMLDAGEYCLDG